MIRKSMPLGHDPMGGYRFSLATNAKRLPGDHAPTKSWSGMTIRRKVIPLWRFFWVCAIPNGPAKWSWKISTRGTNAERSGLNEGGRRWMGDGPLNSRLNRPLRKFWALPRHVLGLINNPW